MLSCKFCPRSFAELNQYHDHTRRHNKLYLKHWLSKSRHTLKKSRKRKRKNDFPPDQIKKTQQWFLYTDGCVRIRTISVNEFEESTPHFTCKVCNRAFSAAIHLIRHERQAHYRESSYGTDATNAGANQTADDKKDKKRFRCRFCERRHHNKADLDYHERSHTGDTITYSCEICKSTFKRKVYLNRHMRIHNDIRPYICKVCGKSFIKGGGLKEHERTHTGEKPYKCPTCHRGFSGRANLRRHEMTHSGEQPFECKICAKRCNRIASLRQHMRIHTGERPYNCMHCNKAFPTCANLRRHERTHLEKKQFHCRQCGKEFTQKYTLKLHEMNHLGIRPHLCLLCGKTFMEKRKLRQHLITVHGVAQESEDSAEGNISEAFGLDLTLEGNKNIDLSDLQPNAISNLEGAHFKSMEDFQAYWKAAYLQGSPIPDMASSGMPSSLFSGQLATPPNESASKLQAILNKLSQNALLNTQLPKNFDAELLKLNNESTIVENPLHVPVPLIKPTESSSSVGEDQPSPPSGQMPKSNESSNAGLITSSPLVSIAKQQTSIINTGQKRVHTSSVKMRKSEKYSNNVLDLTTETGNCRGSGFTSVKIQPSSKLAANTKGRPIPSVPKLAKNSPKTATQITSASHGPDGEVHDSSGTENYSFDSDVESESISPLKVQSNFCKSPLHVEHVKQQALSQNGNSIFNRYNNMSGAFRCDQCGQNFTSEIVLDIHKRTHKAEEHQSYCIVCSKTFNNIVDLETHIQSHNSESHNSSMSSTDVLEARSPHHSISSTATPSMVNDIIMPLLVQTAEMSGNVKTDSSGKKQKKPKGVRKRRIYTCPECNKEYKKSVSLRRHMKIHDVGIVPVECVANVDNMRTHTDVEFPCPVKDRQDNGVTMTSGHMTADLEVLSPGETSDLCNQPTELKEKCMTCFKEFGDKQLLTEHMENHDEPLLITYSDTKEESDEESNADNIWTCAVCDKRFSKQERLAGHMNKHKEYQVKVATMKEAINHMQQVNCERDKINKRWKCPYCPKTLVKRNQIVEHLNDHIGVQPYTCSVCHKGFSKKANYVSHQITHTNELKFECSNCNKKFKHSQSLKKHVIRCKKIYTCEQCYSDFRHKRSLNSHVWNTHVRIENCKCKICGKIMSSASGLREHQMTHNGEKPYKCDICERGFANRSNLRRHVMIHDNTRPFVCNFCQMTFNRLASLQQHERCHTGEKPYPCNHCGLFFTSKSTRRKHEKRHTKQKDIKCKFCDRVFWDKYSCRMHERIHTGDLPYECSLCTKKFPERNVLSRHVKLAHREWFAANKANIEDSFDSDGRGEENEVDFWDTDRERHLELFDSYGRDEDGRVNLLNENDEKLEPLSGDDYHMSSDTDAENDDEELENTEDVDSIPDKDEEGFVNALSDSNQEIPDKDEEDFVKALSDGNQDISDKDEEDFVKALSDGNQDISDKDEEDFVNALSDGNQDISDKDEEDFVNALSDGNQDISDKDEEGFVNALSDGNQDISDKDEEGFVNALSDGNQDISDEDEEGFVNALSDGNQDIPDKDEEGFVNALSDGNQDISDKDEEGFVNALSDGNQDISDKDEEGFVNAMSDGNQDISDKDEEGFVNAMSDGNQDFQEKQIVVAEGTCNDDR